MTDRKSAVEVFIQKRLPDAPVAREPPPRKMTPIVWDPHAEEAAESVRARGDIVVRPAPSVPPPKEPEPPPPKTVTRELKWWESGDEIRKIIITLAGVGVLGGGGAAIFGKKDEQAQAPPPAESCPADVPIKKQKTAFCMRFLQLEQEASGLSSELGTTKTAVGDLQREVQAIGKRVPTVKANP